MTDRLTTPPRCSRGCGAEATHDVRLAKDGETTMRGYLCDACFEQAKEDMRKLGIAPRYEQ